MLYSSVCRCFSVDHADIRMLPFLRAALGPPSDVIEAFFVLEPPWACRVVDLCIAMHNTALQFSQRESTGPRASKLHGRSAASGYARVINTPSWLPEGRGTRKPLMS